MEYPIILNTVSKEAYSLCLQYINVTEVMGSGNDRLITVAHHLTGCSPEVPSKDVDSSIPWCSSWVNLMIVCANIRMNPGMASYVLFSKGFTEQIVRECFTIAGRPFDIFKDQFTGRQWVDPTWSAASKSWDNWGVEIPIHLAQKGDIVRLTRDGGGHVAFLDEYRMGTIFTKLLGGNQKDKVCSLNYMTSRIVTVRRGM